MVVLPALPVMPTTSSPEAARSRATMAAAMAPMASTASGTMICGKTRPVGVGNFAFGQGQHGAGLEGCGNVEVAVRALARLGHEQAAGFASRGNRGGGTHGDVGGLPRAVDRLPNDPSARYRRNIGCS